MSVITSFQQGKKDSGYAACRAFFSNGVKIDTAGFRDIVPEPSGVGDALAHYIVKLGYVSSMANFTVLPDCQTWQEVVTTRAFWDDIRPYAVTNNTPNQLIPLMNELYYMYHDIIDSHINYTTVKSLPYSVNYQTNTLTVGNVTISADWCKLTITANNSATASGGFYGTGYYANGSSVGNQMLTSLNYYTYYTSNGATIPVNMPLTTNVSSYPYPTYAMLPRVICGPINAFNGGSTCYARKNVNYEIRLYTSGGISGTVTVYQAQTWT